MDNVESAYRVLRRHFGNCCVFHTKRGVVLEVYDTKEERVRHIEPERAWLAIPPQD